MEQKGIDEIEESFLAEEVVEEDSSMVKTKTTKDVSTKKASAKTAKASTSKAATKKKSSKMKIETAAPAKESAKAISLEDIEDVKETKAEEKVSTKVKTEEAPAVETKPWEDDSEALFSGGNAWAVLSGVLVILLLISVFTGGFDFGSDAAGIDQAQAESLALEYVNNELLPEPFFAEVTESFERDDVYSVTLSVGGQEIESFVSKDGELFFPQGFDLTGQEASEETSIVELESVTDETVEAEVLEDDEEMVEEESESTDLEEVVAEEVTTLEEETQASGNEVSFDVVAKRWLFEPRELVVSSGDTVTLNIMPEGVSFDFAVQGHDASAFVAEDTSVTFVAGLAGEYQYYCASCEDWRGMTGTLVVN